MSLRHVQGSVFLGAFIALSIIMWHSTQTLYQAWLNSDPSPWYNAFLTDHILKWRLIFEAALVLLLAWPGLRCFRHQDPGQFWKRDGGWGTWR